MSSLAHVHLFRPRRSLRCLHAAGAVLALLFLAAAGASAQAVPEEDASASAAESTPQSTPVEEGLQGGEEGTAFESLTVVGEDRIHVEFERPTLSLDLDPMNAPGLDWGGARDVLDRTEPDLVTPFLAVSAGTRPRYLGRPWLAQLTTGSVASFRLDVEDVERWQFAIVDSRGQAVANFSGRGRPPRELAWDGRTIDGGLVDPGRTYSTIFEAFDRAGNKRNFIGDAFKVSAYRHDTTAGPVVAFSAKEIMSAAGGGGYSFDSTGGQGSETTTMPFLLEAASWINQWPHLGQPYQVITTARSFEQADQISRRVASALSPLIIGDPSRIQSVTRVEPDALAEGTVTIAPLDWNKK